MRREGGSLFPFKSDRRRSTPAELPGRPSVHRMIPYDPNRKRINMLPASLLHPPAPAPHIPRPLLGSEQGDDWSFSLANMICMAMTSNYLLRAEWSKKKLHTYRTTPRESEGAQERPQDKKGTDSLNFPSLLARPILSHRPSVPGRAAFA